MFFSAQLDGIMYLKYLYAVKKSRKSEYQVFVDGQLLERVLLYVLRKRYRHLLTM